MRNRHEEMLPSGAFNSRGSVIGGRGMRLHGGSDMGNWSPPAIPVAGIGPESSSYQAPAVPVAGIGPESSSYQAPAVNPWVNPGTGGSPQAGSGGAPAAPVAPVAPAAAVPVAPVLPGAGGGVTPAYRGVTLNTDATKSSVWNPAPVYYQTTNPVQSQYAWAPRSEATPLQGGIQNWGIQQPTKAFDVNQFINDMLSPKAQSQTSTLPTPYPK